MGRIADTAQTEIPVIWDALKNDTRVGDTTLAARETYITNLIFGSDLTTTQQDALSVLVNEYAAKALAIELVDVSIDFWMVQSQTSAPPASRTRSRTTVTSWSTSRRRRPICYLTFSSWSLWSHRRFLLS